MTLFQKTRIFSFVFLVSSNRSLPMRIDSFSITECRVEMTLCIRSSVTPQVVPWELINFRLSTENPDWDHVEAAQGRHLASGRWRDGRSLYDWQRRQQRQSVSWHTRVVECGLFRVTVVVIIVWYMYTCFALLVTSGITARMFHVWLLHAASTRFSAVNAGANVWCANTAAICHGCDEWQWEYRFPRGAVVT